MQLIQLEILVLPMKILAELEDLASTWFTQKVKEFQAKKKKKIS